MSHQIEALGQISTGFGIIHGRVVWASDCCPHKLDSSKYQTMGVKKKGHAKLLM